MKPAERFRFAGLFVEATMPDVANYTDEQEWMGACVPARIAEGDERDQAAAVCMSMWRERENKSADDTLITFGGEVKALEGGKVAGYLVRFSTADDPDLTGDYFTSQTDFGGAEKSATYYQHGMDVKLGRRVIGEGELKRDDVGVWIEAQLNLRDEYEKAVYQLAKAGKLGWSSGTASHLVERKDAAPGAREITKWPLGLDASLTPNPAEYRNAAIPIKSYQPQMLEVDVLPETEQENRSAAHTPTADADTIKSQSEGETMSDEVLNEIKALAEKVNALETTIKNAPPVSTLTPAAIEVTRDPADVPFKSIADNCNAIKAYEISMGRTMHPRLSNPALKATGASEGVPSDGGFLLDPTLSAEFLAPTHEMGMFSAMARRLPVGSNSNYGWINGIDESSRADGSRWGGIRGYRLNEGGTKTSSKPKFRRINWELKKYAVLVYGTDELLQDAAQFSAVVRQGVGEEINFMLNDDILNGDGAGGPFGILNAPCLVSVTKETNQTAATVVYENLIKMWQRLLPRSKANAAWFVNSEVTPQLDTLSLAAGTAALEPRFIQYGPDGVMRIKGRPVYETEFNAALGTVGDILLADMTQYLMWEKAGIQEAQSIHVQFLTDETVFRFVYRCDGQAALHSALTPYKGSNTQSNFVVVETRS